MRDAIRRLRAWLERIPIEDPLERRDAVSLQLIAYVYFLGLLVIEGGRLLSGITFRTPAASLVNGVFLVCCLVAAWLLRRGRYRAGTRLFVFGFAAVFGVAIAGFGLEFSRDALKNLSIPLALAALLLGPRALWSMLLFFIAAMAVGLARDRSLLGGTGPHPAPAAPLGVLLLTAVSFALLIIILDRFGHTVREAYSKLRRANDALETEMKQRKRVEAQLYEAQKMEAIARLSGGVAHDFNNLLTVIMGFADVLRRGLKDDPRTSEVDEILAAAGRGSALTRQLLAFASKQILEPRVVRLDTQLGSVEGMLRRLIGEDVELRTLAAPGLFRVKIDPSQLEQVLVNLIVNARDAMPRGGTLTIEMSNVVLEEPLRGSHGTAGPGKYALLAVSDTGVGMDEETQRRLFEPFFTTKERGKGTGLGLATCYGIVQQAGGAIAVYSEKDQGTTFKVYLPATEEPEEPIAPRLAAEVVGGHETVLVIEDDAQLRALSVRAMRESGYQVLEAANGDEAVHISQAHPGHIDLMVTDVVLPRRNGREVAEEIAAQRPRMQVLFVSGYTEDSAVLKGVLEAGIHFLAKPFTPVDLARKVRGVLDSRAAG